MFLGVCRGGGTVPVMLDYCHLGISHYIRKIPTSPTPLVSHLQKSKAYYGDDNLYYWHLKVPEPMAKASFMRTTGKKMWATRHKDPSASAFHYSHSSLGDPWLLSHPVAPIPPCPLCCPAKGLLLKRDRQEELVFINTRILLFRL